MDTVPNRDENPTKGGAAKVAGNQSKAPNSHTSYSSSKSDHFVNTM